MLDDIVQTVLKNFKEDITSSAYNRKELNDLFEDLSNFHTKEATNDLKVNVKKLEEEAKLFIDTIKRLASTENFDSVASKLGTVTYGYEKRTYRLRLAYLAALRFSTYFQRYLGQPIAKYIVVFDGEGTVYSQEYEIMNFIKGIGSQGHLHENWLLEEQSKIYSQINNDEHYQKIQAAYNSLAKKMSDNERKGREVYKIYFKNKKVYKQATVLNYGDLKEAYAKALYTPHDSKYDYFKTIKVYDMEDKDDKLAFMLYSKYVTQVDSQEAILGEDISLKDVQYGVKAANAQMPSLTQYYRVASNICDKKGFTINEIIEEEKKNFGGGVRNKFIESISKEIEKSVK